MDIEKKQAESHGDIDLSTVFLTLWHSKLLILLALIISVFIGGYYAFLGATPRYKAQATVALKDQKEQVVDIASIMTGLSSDQSAINTEIEVMRSRGIIEKLVNQLELVNDPEFNIALRPKKLLSTDTIGRFAKSIGNSLKGQNHTDAGPHSEIQTEREILDGIIDLALSSISVHNIRKSYVFNIIATTENSVKSANIANALAAIYIQNQLDVKFKATEQATVWLGERASKLKTELEQAEKDVRDFTSSTDLIGPESLAALTRQIKELRDRLAKAIESETQIGLKIEEIKTISKNKTPTEIAKILNDHILTEIIQGQGASETKNYDAFNARVQRLLDTKMLEKRNAHNQIITLRKSIFELSERIASQSDDLITLQQLEREAEANRQIYGFFLERLKETSAQQGILQADSRILSQAVPRAASAPKKTLILILSLFFGLGAGSGFVILREMMRVTIQTSEDLEAKTGYIVMGQIPKMPVRSRKNVLQYLSDKPTSAVAESIRNLRTSILLSNVDNPPKIIMSTSSIPGEGKTTQSLALAQNLSGLDKKVLLVEGDIRRRVFGEYFKINGKKGLLSILLGEEKLEDVTIYIEDLKADILIGEKSTTNAADIFSSDRFHAFLDDARKKYDYIIIDTPPVLVVPDARVIGQLVDSIIYSVKWDSTPRRLVLQGLKSLEDVGVKATGLVLAQINEKGMKRQGYGSYNSYYDE